MLNFRNTTIAFILAFLALFALSLVIYFPIWVYFVLLGSWVLVVAVGSFSMRFNFFLNAFTRKKEHGKKQVALTFDDGPHPIYTKKVLELLKDHKAKATFFCIGKNAEKYPEIIKAIKDGGHTIANHSYSHKNTIAFNGTKCWLPEIKETDAILEKITGERPELFRPPYGVTTPHLAKALALTYHDVIGWNARSYDTVLKNKKEVLLSLRKKVAPGAILLLHDTHDRIEDILEHMLVYLKEKEYKTVTINELMNET